MWLFSYNKDLEKDDKNVIKKADYFSLNFNQSWENVNHSGRIQETLDVGKIIKSHIINSILFFCSAVWGLLLTRSHKLFSLFLLKNNNNTFLLKIKIIHKNKNNKNYTEEKFTICNLS